MSIFFDDSGVAPVMLEEDWGLSNTSNINIEKAMRSHLEHIRSYTPPPKRTQCDGTFWGELINTDILHKTKKRTGNFDL